MRALAASLAVFVDDGAQCGVAVEGGAADAGACGDGGEGDGLAGGGEFGAGLLGPGRCALGWLIRPVASR